MDTGTAYDFETGTHDRNLTEVGRGTPMGELMRRYWMPVATAAEASAIPRRVRVLGEDLILFRDRSGRPGLMYPRCVHRGASLFYGAVEEDGIRCCYHGWKYDVEGNCIDQPCEPDRGKRSERFRQPWYPVEERYGVVFAYLGPPARKPLLPRYNVFEELSSDEQLFVDTNNLGAGTFPDVRVVPFNWLQHFENIHDTAHFLWLHYLHSGPQFTPGLESLPGVRERPWEWVRQTSYRETERGIMALSRQDRRDGGTLTTKVETVLPCIRGVPNPMGKPGPVDHLGFMLPIDDTSFRIITVLRERDDRYFQWYARMMTRMQERQAADPTLAQRHPSDYESQGSQGPITLHSEEKLVSSDLGVVMLRRQLRKQMEIVKAGGDPLNVAFEPGSETILLEAGSFASRGDLAE